MTAGAMLLTLGAVLAVAGLVGTVNAMRGVRLLPPRTRSTGRAALRVTPRHLLALACGVGVLLLTGWPVAGLGTAAGVLFVPSVLGGGSAARALVAKSEALADWTRRLADLISSGAASSTRDALHKSLGSVPGPIADPVRRLDSRVGPHSIETALRRFAAEVNDPAADKIAGVLILRDRNGGPGLADVLTALAIALDERSRMIREVESERAKPRANMRTIVIVTAVLVVAMMLFARTFLSPYSSPLGQALLVLVVVVFAIALRWMHRLAAPVRDATVLVDPAASEAGRVRS